MTPQRTKCSPKPCAGGSSRGHDTKNAIQRYVPDEPSGRVTARCDRARYRPKLQLWMDGVLLDEEFPVVSRVGDCSQIYRAAQLAMVPYFPVFMTDGSCGAMARALSDEEICVLSGGGSWLSSGLGCWARCRNRCSIFAPGAQLKGGRLFPTFYDGLITYFISSFAATCTVSGMRPWGLEIFMLRRTI